MLPPPYCSWDIGGCNSLRAWTQHKNFTRLTWQAVMAFGTCTSWDSMCWVLGSCSACDFKKLVHIDFSNSHGHQAYREQYETASSVCSQPWPFLPEDLECGWKKSENLNAVLHSSDSLNVTQASNKEQIELTNDIGEDLGTPMTREIVGKEQFDLSELDDTIANTDRLLCWKLSDLSKSSEINSWWQSRRYIEIDFVDEFAINDYCAALTALLVLFLMRSASGDWLLHANPLCPGLCWLVSLPSFWV